MFKNNKLFFWTIEILAVALLIFMLTKIEFIFQPIRTFLGLLFVPFIIAGFLYYIFKPITQFLEKKLKMSRTLSAFAVLLILIIAIALIIATVLPNVISQLTELISSSGKIYPNLRNWVESLSKNPQFHELYERVNVQSLVNKLNLSYVEILNNILNNLTNSIGSFIGVISSIVMVVILAPILLFYMIKDGHKIIPFLREHVLTEDKLKIVDLLDKMNQTISRYISGISIDATFVFVMVFIGYLVMGVPYAFLFALFSGITNMIPYVGPYIGVIPMLLTVVFVHPWTALAALIYTLVIQQIDGNVIYPKIIGNAVKIHPVTVMVLMLISGSLYGITGMIIAVPAYSLVKEIVKFIVALYKNHTKQKLLQESDATDNEILK